jgi:hypothetical protein
MPEAWQDSRLCAIPVKTGGKGAGRPVSDQRLAPMGGTQQARDGGLAGTVARAPGTEARGGGPGKVPYWLAQTIRCIQATSGSSKL